MESYLRQQGWDHTSKFPDSRWRWKKTLPDGQMLTLSTQGAFDMESRFLDMHEQEGEVK